MKYNKTDEFCFFISGSWGENANRERLLEKVRQK